MKKNSLYLLFALGIIFPYFSVSALEDCPYLSQYLECIEANRSGSPRSITDFVCIASENTNEVMYNIVLDMKFKEIDRELTQECSNLENSKGYYF
jgi:hypothetical protein